MARGFSCPHTSTSTTWVFGSCVHNSELIIDKTILPHMSHLNPPPILYFLTKEDVDVGECRAFPQLFLPTWFLPLAVTLPPSFASLSLRFIPNTSVSLPSLLWFSICLFSLLYRSAQQPSIFFCLYLRLFSFTFTSSLVLSFFLSGTARSKQNNRGWFFERT